MGTETGNGWIKLHRSIIDSKLWSCSDATFRIGLYLILSANHKPRWVRRVWIERGQCVRSLTQIADDCHETRNTVRYALKVLKEDEFIKIDEPFGTHQGHRISICKYETYQAHDGDEGHTQDTGTDTRGDTRTDHKQEWENGENDKNTPHNPPKGENAPKSFKQWTDEEFKEAIRKANEDGLLTQSQCWEFFNYWTEPGATGKRRYQYKKTWDTRRRMHTAKKRIFDKAPDKNEKNQGGTGETVL